MARRWPQLIGHVVALGAPLMFAGAPLSASVAMTSIYTADLPFHPESREAHARNIQVTGSHDGLCANVRVYRLVAQLLAQARSEN
jgi:hypothetical protein